MKINVNLYPKDGYFFKDADGSTHRNAGGWKGVIARVVEYRRRNNLPPGDPETEVMAQACQRNPSLCREESAQQRQQRRVVSLKGRMLAWLSSIRQAMPKGPLRFVSGIESLERGKICINCPNNQALPEGCSSCRAAVREMRKEILGSRGIDARLHGCAILGQDNCVATHLDEQRVENGSLPNQCWRKRNANS